MFSLPKFIGDKRTEAQKQQNELFQFIGTLARTRANLNNLVYCKNVVSLSDSDKDKLVHALGVLQDLSISAGVKMKNLPNKKRLAAEANQTKENSNDN